MFAILLTLALLVSAIGGVVTGRRRLRWEWHTTKLGYKYKRLRGKPDYIQIAELEEDSGYELSVKFPVTTLDGTTFQWTPNKQKGTSRHDTDLTP